MRQRQVAEPDFVRRDRQRQRQADCHAHRGDHVDVLHHHALGHSGGAAGVHDGVDVFGRGRRVLGSSSCLLLEGADHVSVAEDLQALGLDLGLGVGVPLAEVHNCLEVLGRVAGVDLIVQQLGHQLERLVLADDDLRARVRNDVACSVGAERVVHGDDGPVVGDAGEGAEQPLGAIARPEGDLLLLAQAVHLPERHAESPRLRLDLRVRHSLPRARHIDDGGLWVGVAIWEHGVLESVWLRAARNGRLRVERRDLEDRIVHRPQGLPRGDDQPRLVLVDLRGIALRAQAQHALRAVEDPLRPIVRWLDDPLPGVLQENRLLGKVHTIGTTRYGLRKWKADHCTGGGKIQKRTSAGEGGQGET
mmetsp:Transcript_63548/g.196764  ORF Transcript_63548/g.196764 Transcript_63548/m.196764 type:complete len:362 (+) Transcript_63548:1467-2552(+)